MKKEIKKLLRHLAYLTLGIIIYTTLHFIDSHYFATEVIWYGWLTAIGLVVIFNLGRYVGEYDIKKKMDFITYCFMREKEYSIEKGNT